MGDHGSEMSHLIICLFPLYLLIELHIALYVFDINTGQNWKGGQSSPSQLSYFTAEDTGVDGCRGHLTRCGLYWWIIYSATQKLSTSLSAFSVGAFTVSSAPAENNLAHPHFLNLNIWNTEMAHIFLHYVCILMLHVCSISEVPIKSEQV